MYSQTRPQMILVASPSKLFEYTSKGNLRRQRMIDAYANEINDLYASVAESAQEDIPGPPQWTLEETTQFVKSVIGRTLKTRSTSIDENADLFEHGLDRCATIRPIYLLLKLRLAFKLHGSETRSYVSCATTRLNSRISSRSASYTNTQPRQV